MININSSSTQSIQEEGLTYILRKSQAMLSSPPDYRLSVLEIQFFILFYFFWSFAEM